MEHINGIMERSREDFSSEMTKEKQKEAEKIVSKGKEDQPM